MHDPLIVQGIQPLEDFTLWHRELDRQLTASPEKRDRSPCKHAHPQTTAPNPMIEVTRLAAFHQVATPRITDNLISQRIPDASSCS